MKKIVLLGDSIRMGYDKYVKEALADVAEVYYGRGEADAPDVDGKVYFRAKKGNYFPGDFIEVRVTEALDYDLVGDPLRRVDL